MKSTECSTAFQPAEFFRDINAISIISTDAFFSTHSLSLIFLVPAFSREKLSNKNHKITVTHGSFLPPVYRLCSHWDLGSFVVDNIIMSLSVFVSKQITHVISPALKFPVKLSLDSTKTRESQS